MLRKQVVHQKPLFHHFKRTLCSIASSSQGESLSRNLNVVAASFRLSGPPEIYSSSSISTFTPSRTPQPSISSSSGGGDPFIDLMTANFNKTQTEAPTPPPRGFTENHSPTYLSTGNPCLDFFFHVVPDTEPETLVQLLDLSWKHNPMTTLKLICQLRGVRGTGKSDKEGFYTAAMWLYKNHPKTLASNVKCFAEFGYFKDLVQILYKVLGGPDNFRQKRKGWQAAECRKVNAKIQRESGVPREKRIALEMKRMQIQEELAREIRKAKGITQARKAVEKYISDAEFRFLHDQISQVFADYLVSDLKNFNSGSGGISLASKWCPSLDSTFDKTTLLCESIARRVFPRESYAEYEGLEEAHYAYRVRDRLRKEVLVPLHNNLELPEIYMSFNKWNSLPYNRVASIAMRNYKELFLEHDGDRFNEFLNKVKSGEAKIAAGALFPHDIIKSLDDKDGGQVAELQWKRMVEDLSAKGKLSNCLAICDVSGSMRGMPMDVSVSLGLLISELSEDPWKGKLITFSQNPQLHKIEGDDLSSKTQFIEDMQWDMNTDFQKVFDQILQVAVDGKLSNDEMIKKLFVFSDMEFDEASRPAPNYYSDDSRMQSNSCYWNTDYEVIQRKFEEKGYTVPQIVFWNLRDSKATPVPSFQPGVALVSGFSKNLIKLFLEEDDKIMSPVDPESVLHLAISGPEYEQLVVVD
ncbi:hypothetical protein IFM89_025400 [Coptis chinensis]|uniref:Uncharacterized protein n=1 Tax=Coptis chinensis TaxID=261450 RepID=A0A835H7K3_9MAGN|nr:hypothetical protein IFM89_025400 [Coptis chinensis]